MQTRAESTLRLPILREAAARIADATLVTPLIRLPLDGNVYAKAESLQHTRSFKLRGAYNFLASLSPEERRRGVVTHSSGNHAQGVACAAYKLGVKATIVIPDNAPEIKVRRTAAWGAEVVRCESSSSSREALANALAEERGAILVPPYDHPWIVAGQASVGLEIADALADVKNVLVCVGGGGLIAGIALALHELCPQAQVIGVEPELAADAADSFAKGSVQRWEAQQTSRTIADGVRVQSIGELNFAVIQRHVHGFVTVSEDAIKAWTRWYALEAGLVVEPTGALTAAAYERLCRGDVPGLQLQAGPTVLLISGGNIDPAQLLSLLQAP